VADRKLTNQHFLVWQDPAGVVRSEPWITPVAVPESVRWHLVSARDGWDARTVAQSHWRHWSSREARIGG